jgi:UDP-glucose 4-epimerase
LTIFGDGRQTRDYVYAGDVAQANLLAATREIPPAGSLDVRAFNIGTGTETDVVTLATMLKEVANAETPVDHAPERVGEVRRSALDAAKAKHSLGWPRLIDGSLANMNLCRGQWPYSSSRL